MFKNVCRRPKKTVKMEQDHAKFLKLLYTWLQFPIPPLLYRIFSQHHGQRHCELFGLKLKPSRDSFTFMDKSKANLACMINIVKVEIWEYNVPVDFHVVEIKSGWKSSLLFGRAFMATVEAV